MDEKVDKDKAPYPKKSLALQGILFLGVPLLIVLLIFFMIFSIHK